jgi:hypothetical protein
MCVTPSMPHCSATHCIDTPCFTGTFDLLVYTDAASAVPSEWCAHAGARPAMHQALTASGACICVACDAVCREESDARLVSGAESVRLRSFSTRVHKVEACVAYKADDASAL